MKVAIIENINNSGFTLMRYLNHYGIDTDLLLIQEGPSYFKAEADSYNDDYYDKIKYLGWFEKRTKYFTTTRAEIKKVLDNYDFIIGQGYATVFCEKAGRKLDIFLPFGSDIYYFPFYRYPVSRSGSIQLIQWIVSKIHKSSIQKAGYISFDYTNAESELVLQRLKSKAIRLMLPFPSVFLPQYKSEDYFNYRDRNDYYKKIIELKSTFKYIIFHHARHNWVEGDVTFSYKGNDKLIKGLARAVKKVGKDQFALVTLDYGKDVSASKELIESLGISENVFWFPTMERKDIMCCIDAIDIGVGELGKSWFSYGVIYEFISFSKPVMHTRDDKLYDEIYPVMYPMYNVNTEEDVEKWLIQMVDKPEQFNKTGSQAGKWFNEFAVQKPIEVYSEIINKSIAELT